MHLSQEDKIDYLYDEMKKDESHRRWSRIWSWMWRIFMIASTYWLYLHPETMFDLLKGANGRNLSGLSSLGTSGQSGPSGTELLNVIKGAGGSSGITGVGGPGQPATVEDLVK